MTFANPSGEARAQGEAAPHASHTKYLLITSDDFGMCHSVNAGIVRAMTEGVVTSTTFMAPCPWFSEAVWLAKEHGLKVGVHLCLTCEWDRMRWGPITRAPSLVGPDGYFWPGFPELERTAKDDEVVEELEAQIRRVRASGVEPTHVDIHMLGGDDQRPCVTRFRDAIKDTCKKHGLVYIRDYDRQRGLVHMTDQIGMSGLTEEAIWQALQAWTEPGFYHIICHAAAGTSELDAICSVGNPARYWGAPYRLADLVFLTRPSTRARLEELGFRLVDAPTVLAASNGSR